MVDKHKALQVKRQKFFRREKIAKPEINAIIKDKAIGGLQGDQWYMLDYFLKDKPPTWTMRV